MEFTYKDHHLDDGATKRVLYLNKTHTPGTPDGIFELPTDKPSIMLVLQELFDMIEWEPREKVFIETTSTEPMVIPSLVPEPDAIVLKDQWTIKADEALTPSKELHLRMLISSYWDSFPTSFKIDMVNLTLEELRPLLNKIKLGD